MACGAGVVLTETQRYIERGRHLEKLRKRLRGEGQRGVFLPSPLLYFKPINISLKNSF